jgi:acetyltransferase-like isoleucine patch superfamily enzyme
MRSSVELGQFPTQPDAIGTNSVTKQSHFSSHIRRGRVRSKLRCLGLMLATMAPGSFLRKLIYRFGFGYRFGRNVRIGLAFLDCDRLSIGDNSRIGTGVVFLGCAEVIIGRNVLIGSLNLFRGGDVVELEDFSQVLRFNVINAIPENDCTNEPESTFKLGYGSVITAEHRIDFTDKVTIGRCTIFGGRNSSIWTHNRREGMPVSIGDYCYVGSEIRMAPGASVPNCCVVGLGTVLTKPIREPWSLIAGVPGKRMRTLGPDDIELIFGKTRKDLPNQEYPDIPGSISKPE